MSKISDTDAGIDDQQRALETRGVTITLQLPLGIADKVEELQAAEPGFLEYLVQSGLMRRAVYRGIRERELADKSHTTEEV